ncbi:putative acetyl transferase [Bifidobacterium pullorum subsp. saeculare DSM 6531 = LMG 14934]|uniref:Putative acetyl transferase n=1 Tax=Bifidobacterium pullorum subsp. saeculare DSM 6531 = LMG 14934 TaxID=1437611 RepID=A0A087CPG4_9BIFI|nr:acyltransferase [Bifidobacterium pullorum]KFI85164.1 putative acetyl transferase [Bifidobacterium pullorum subsp. saeculare DSM 6531 = LMG 14934]
MKFNKNISCIDKYKIFKYASIKFIRGCWNRMFLSHSEGLLLIGKHVTMSHASNIYCGKNVKFEDYSEIHGLCSHGLHFGNNVTIGRNVMIRPSSYYGGDLGYGLFMGDNSSIGPDGFIGCSGPIRIGCNVMIGPKCSLFAENHVFKDLKATIKSQGVSQKGISIGNDCWIGSNVVILDGVHIGNHVVIGAGCLITRDIPDNVVVIDAKNKKMRVRK